MPAVVNQNPEGGYGGHQKLNFTSPPPSFHTDNLPSMNSTQHDPMDLEADNNISTPEGDSDDFDDDDDSPSNLEISGWKTDTLVFSLTSVFLFFFFFFLAGSQIYLGRALLTCGESQYVNMYRYK